MKVSIIAIGNSRGVRLPKTMLEQVGLRDEAELSIENGRIVLAPAKAVREGWAQAYAATPIELSEDDAEWLKAPLTDDSTE